MKLFNKENTEGYSEAEIDRLNQEWEERVEEFELEEGSADYFLQALQFREEVAARES